MPSQLGWRPRQRGAPYGPGPRYFVFSLDFSHRWIRFQVNMHAAICTPSVSQWNPSQPMFRFLVLGRVAIFMAGPPLLWARTLPFLGRGLGERRLCWWSVMGPLPFFGSSFKLAHPRPWHLQWWVFARRVRRPSSVDHVSQVPSGTVLVGWRGVSSSSRW